MSFTLPFGWSLSRTASRNGRTERTLQDTERLRDYEYYLRCYRGRSQRAPVSQATPLQTHRLTYNLNRPVVNIGAFFLAGKPLTWSVEGDPAAGKMANEIWDRSGSDGAFLEAAMGAGIYGDVVGVAAENEAGEPIIQFVEPAICFPTFDGSDSRKLVQLDITWETEDRETGRMVLHREFYDQTGVTVYEGEEITDRRPASRIPAAWIRNSSVMGLTYGVSDLDDAAPLVEEYDHLAGKQTRIVDYYAAPNIVFEGMQARDLDKTTNTMLFLPKDAKAYFLEWQGNQPATPEHLDRIRRTLCEVTQIPGIAFAQVDEGFSNLSGVALEIVFQPLLAKTQGKRASWGPGLEYLMWLCLQARGFTVSLPAVDAVWETPLPKDYLALTQEANAAVGGNLRSIRTAMAAQGVENPEVEIKRIITEKSLFTLGQPQEAPQIGPDGVPVAMPEPPGAEDIFAEVDAWLEAERRALAVKKPEEE